jgi:hypothetical protein
MALANSAQQGLQTSCLHGGWWGGTELDGGQREAVRVPLADGTLVALPVGPDHAHMPSLLTLSDVMGTGYHAALRADVRPGTIVPWLAMARWVSAASLPPVVSVCVGHGESMRTAVIARAGGAVGRVGVPQETAIPNAQPTFYAKISPSPGARGRFVLTCTSSCPTY